MIHSRFSRFSFREQMMVVVVTWVVVIFLLNITFGNYKELYSVWSRASETLASNALLLAKQEDLKKALREARKHVARDKTLSSAQLVGRLDQIARQMGLNYDIAQPRTTSEGAFTLSNVRMTVRKMDMSRLLAFSEAITAIFPYIALHEMRLVAGKANPAMLDGRFVFDSFEINGSAPSE